MSIEMRLIERVADSPNKDLPTVEVAQAALRVINDLQSALSEARAEVERLRLRLKDLREELHDYWAGDSCKYADGAEADEANECGDISCRAHRAWRALEWDSAALTPSDGQTEAETWPSEAAREAWDRALPLSLIHI